MRRQVSTFVTTLLLMIVPGQVVAELRPEQAEKAQALIKQFGAVEFVVRQEAVERLIEMGPDVLPLLKKILAETKDPEVKLRCQMVIRALSPKKPEPTVAICEKAVKNYGPVSWWVARTPDGQVLARVRRQGKKRIFVYKGVEGPVFDQISHYCFSPDGKRFAYKGKHGNNWFIVCMGKDSHGYDAVERPVFSPDGKHLAYSAKEAGKAFVVMDGKAGVLYDSVSTKPTFSSDSKRMAYRAQRAGKSFIVCNGKELIAYNDVGEPIFSPDSKHLGYRARQTDEDFNTTEFMVVDGKPGKAYHRVCYDPVFSPDSDRLAYGAQRKRGGKWCLVVDGKESGAYDHIGKNFRPKGPTFSPDSKRMACQVWHDGKRFMLCDGKEGRPYESISRPIFSPDSKHMIYLVQRNERWLLVYKDMEGKDYDRVGSQPFFSPDSRHVVYDARHQPKGAWFVVLDGLEGPGYSWVDFSTRWDKIHEKLRYAVGHQLGEPANMVEVDWPWDLDFTHSLTPAKP